MQVEYITTMDDYEWSKIPKKLLNEVKEKMTLPIYKEKINCKFSQIKKVRHIDTQTVWNLHCFNQEAIFYGFKSLDYCI